MNKKFKKSLFILLPILFGAFLIWYYLNKFTPKELNKIIYDLKHANYYWIFLSLFFGILSHISRAYRWHFMLEPLGFKPRLGNSIMAVLIAYLLNLAIPRSGEIGRAATMAKYENIPFEKGLGTIVAERIADIIMLLIILGIVFFLQANLILEYFSNTNPTTKIIILLIIVLLFFIGFKLLKKSTHKIVLKIKIFFNGLIEGVTSIFKMKKKGAFVFHTVFIWLMYILMFWAVTFTIPETSKLSFEAILVGFIAGAIAMSITNGGFGAYPVFVFKALLLYGINKESGTSFGLLMWSSQTIMVLLFGGLSFLFLPIYNRKK
ncbi:MAG: flippase-like domain-containing protein [Flavobacteriaceae bacterium]|nr:flippase-like domain-containing protein [Flavobacteriaceae bacterium]